MSISTIRRHILPCRGNQSGQTLIIFGLAFIFLIGIVGLAVDSSYAYFRSIQVERAAAAAALAGVPYMPKQFNSPASGNAFDRAILEAKRNGFDASADPTVTVVPCCANDLNNELSVTITAQSNTFFLSALGIKKVPIKRTAVAGYKQPIALGQPGNQIGSEVSQLGAGTAFYFPRYKGWNNARSEGDPFTPNPTENGGTSKDIHQFSNVNGLESVDVKCDASLTYSLPCRGGFSWRVTVPDGVNAIVQVYNAADAPDFGTHPNVNYNQPGCGGASNQNCPKNLVGNNCENVKNLSVCNTNAPKTNAPYHYHEDDLGNANACPCDPTHKGNYNATAYTLMNVPDLFLRSQDAVLTQSIVYPVDATNFDGNAGKTGPGAVTTPSYVNVNTGAVITQGYSGTQPCNMQIYHAWMDVANYDGSTGLCNGGDGGLVQRKASTCGTPCTANGATTAGALGGGTYRLRVDALNNDGTFAPSITGGQEIGGSSSKGYSVRVVDATTKLPCTGCKIAGWQDMVVYTPLDAGTGTVPLFELTSDYAGATIDVDVFDLGDASGTVNLAILNPAGNPAVLGASGSITNDGISRLFPGTAHVPPQWPIPKPQGAVAQIPSGSAKYEAASAGYCNGSTGSPATLQCGPEYQGSWIRLTIPIPSGYIAPAYPGDFWSLQYFNSGGASDTFGFTVGARGGPVHLLSS